MKPETQQKIANWLNSPVVVTISGILVAILAIGLAIAFEFGKAMIWHAVWR